MVKSEAVETPATEGRMKLKRPKWRVWQYRTWATLIENGKGETVVKALRELADKLDGK